MSVRQDVFNQVVAGISSQGWRKAMDNDGHCRYRAVDGNGNVLKCAIGWLIPDDEYHPTMNTRPLSFVIDQSPTLSATRDKLTKEIASKLGVVPNGAGYNFLYSLQRAHDMTNGTPEDMKTSLRIFAIGNGIDLPPEFAA